MPHTDIALATHRHQQNDPGSDTTDLTVSDDQAENSPIEPSGWLTASPFGLIGGLWQFIPRYVKVQFLSAFILGLLVHMYLMVNGFINQDSVSARVDNHLWAGFISGRWFADIPDSISSHFNLPWVNSLFSVVYISIACCLIGICLRITRTPLVVVLSAVVVSFPAVACALSYRLDSDVHFFAALLACLAVYMTYRFRFGFAAGVPLLTFSLATYQAHVGFFVGIAILILVREVLTTDKLRPVLVHAGTYFLTLVLAGVAYAISVKLTIVGWGPGYHDLSDLGGVSPSSILNGLGVSYSNTFDIFVRNSLLIHQGAGQNSHLYGYVFLIIGLIVVGLLVSVVIDKQVFRDPSRLIVLIVLVGLVPAGVNFIAVLTPTTLYILMQYSLVLLFAFALMVVDIAVIPAAERRSLTRTRVTHLGTYLILAFCCAVALNYALYSNIFYSKMDLVNKQGQAFSTELVTRIQSQNDYTPTMPVVLLGSPQQSWALGDFESIYAIPLEGIPNMYAYPAYLLTFLDLQNPMAPASKDTASLPPPLEGDASAVAAIQQMPQYPVDGSIMAVDGFMVVKLSG